MRFCDFDFREYCGTIYKVKMSGPSVNTASLRDGMDEGRVKLDVKIGSIRRVQSAPSLPNLINYSPPYFQIVSPAHSPTSPSYSPPATPDEPIQPESPSSETLNSLHEEVFDDDFDLNSYHYVDKEDDELFRIAELERQFKEKSLKRVWAESPNKTELDIKIPVKRFKDQTMFLILERNQK